MADPQQNDWPPAHAEAFIRTQEFGDMLIELVRQLADRYLYMDFTDATAQVFSWFDGKLSREPEFLRERFPTLGAFKAYLRQAVWNAARLAERKRQRRERIVALPTDRPIATQEMSPEEQDNLLDLIDGLEHPYNLVFTKYFFEEEDPFQIGSTYGWSEKTVQEIFAKAIDMIRKKLKRQTPSGVKKR